MDVPALLEAACLLVPAATATENDLTVDDVWEHLAHDDWETALGLLESLGDARPLPLDFWADLAGAAEQLRLERSAAWCRWRWNETRRGVIRAGLTLEPAAENRRRTPFAGAGALRPLWDIGHRAPDGGPAFDVAALWVEHTPFLAPGEHATVRLAPLDPARWRHLRPGHRITMHEGRPVGGTATVLEVLHPAGDGSSTEAIR
ncbi:hypothetical protein [Kitasatospora terrestris]|uniref:Uncharacterized protein n=1 Tax=Kitasatospora terrestris TaxID=258051 RepID=A0ABP9D6F5_9ACTN